MSQSDKVTRLIDEGRFPMTLTGVIHVFDIIQKAIYHVCHMRNDVSALYRMNLAVPGTQAVNYVCDLVRLL